MKANHRTIRRQPTADEKRLLELNELHYERLATAKYRWGRHWLAFCVLAGCGYGMYTASGWLFGLSIFLVFFTLLVIALSASTFRGEKKRAGLLLVRLAILKNAGYFEVQRFTCTRALFIPDPEDIGDLYVLEVGKNDLFILRDVDFKVAGFFPNSKFEIYTDPLIAELLNQDTVITGKPIQPLRLPAELNWDASELITDYGRVVPGTVDGFIEQLKEQLAKTGNPLKIDQ